jgi:hypothetical protein
MREIKIILILILIITDKECMMRTSAIELETPKRIEIVY